MSSILPISADQAWGMMTPATLVEITRGMVGFAGDLPAEFHEGDVIHTRVRLLNLLPAYDYEFRLVRVDRPGGRIVSHERGGMVRSWKHQISIEPLTQASCRHTDEIEIGAGPATPLVWAFANLFYRVRHSRERRLALALGQGA
jgi:hypothetical protein